MPNFTITNYVTDSGSQRPIRLLQAKLATWNEPGAGPVAGEFVFANRSAKRYGLFARQFILSRIVGTDPDTATKSVSVPVLDPAVYDATPLGDQLSYDGQIWTLASKIGERAK